MVIDNMRTVNADGKVVALTDYREGLEARTDLVLLTTTVAELGVAHHRSQEDAVACHLLIAALIHKKYKGLRLFPRQVAFLN